MLHVPMGPAGCVRERRPSFKTAPATCMYVRCVCMYASRVIDFFRLQWKCCCTVYCCTVYCCTVYCFRWIAVQYPAVGRLHRSDNLITIQIRIQILYLAYILFLPLWYVCMWCNCIIKIPLCKANICARVVSCRSCKENMIYSIVDLADHTNQQIMEL